MYSGNFFKTMIAVAALAVGSVAFSGAALAAVPTQPSAETMMQSSVQDQMPQKLPDSPSQDQMPQTTPDTPTS